MNVPPVSYPLKNKNLGFTLIELLVVIILLGILAVIAMPKFINLKTDAHIATVSANAGTFKAGINLAHTVWAIKVGSGPKEDLPVFGASPDGVLDFNDKGWPAQHYDIGNEASPALDNVDDCISVWQTLFQGDRPSISRLDSITEATDYKAEYLTQNQCTYLFRENDKLSIHYDSRSGAVMKDLDPNS